MSDSSTVDCLVCRKHRGEVTIAGGVIFEDDLIFISHAQLWVDEKDHYLGHVFVEPKRHVAELADLTEQESQTLGIYTSRVAKALMMTEGMEHIYSFVFGDGVPHVHIHVIGRHPGTPRENWGAKLERWPGALRGKEPEIGLVSARLRVFFDEHFGGR